MEQLDLDQYDKVAAAKARDRALAAVQRSTGDWQLDALNAIRRIASAKEFFTTDDVWRELGKDPELEGRAMGAAVRIAAGMGLVRKTDRTTKSHRVACHRRDVRVWQSRIYEGPATT